MKTCPKCSSEWPEDCEQAISIEIFSECFTCKFIKNNGTNKELQVIVSERDKRVEDEENQHDQKTSN